MMQDLIKEFETMPSRYYVMFALLKNGYSYSRWIDFNRIYDLRGDETA